MRPTLILGASLSLAACAHEHTACVEAPTAGHEHRHGHGHGHAEGGETPAHHHRFDDAARWAQEFENPERDAWQLPDLVVSSLSLARDAHVADIGAGTGYFAVRLARAAPEGRVWGVDVEPSMVRWLNERARREGITNLFSTSTARRTSRRCGRRCVRAGAWPWSTFARTRRSVRRRRCASPPRRCAATWSRPGTPSSAL